MSWSNLRRLISPVVLLVCAIVLRPYAVSLEPAYFYLVQYVPYVLLIFLLSLCIYYNRSRLFTSAIAFLLVYYIIQTYLQTTLTEPETLLIYSLISVLQPVTLFIFIFLPERGIFNRYGFLSLAIVLLILVVATLLLRYFSAPVLIFVNDWLLIKPFSGHILSISASACYVLVIIVAMYRLLRRNDDFALTIFSMALFTFVVLSHLDWANISSVMFSICSIGLLIGILGASYDMAYRDELTGILGRRALTDRMKGLGRSYVIAMMDVDHFKNFNDTHGHDIGDEVLKMVAKQIDSVKGGGTAYRYGGEEFCVVYNGRDLDYCKPYLEQVRLNIQDYQMKLRDDVHRPKSKTKAKQQRGRSAKNRKDKTVSVTISIGMAKKDDKHVRPESVLKASDTALYKAKNKGRNCLAY